MWLERKAAGDARNEIAVDAVAREREHDDSDARTGLTAIDGGLV
jgi:hypothetical protein